MGVKTADNYFSGFIFTDVQFTESDVKTQNTKQTLEANTSEVYFSFNYKSEMNMNKKINWAEKG